MTCWPRPYAAGDGPHEAARTLIRTGSEFLDGDLELLPARKREQRAARHLGVPRRPVVRVVLQLADVLDGPEVQVVVGDEPDDVVVADRVEDPLGHLFDGRGGVPATLVGGEVR